MIDTEHLASGSLNAKPHLTPQEIELLQSIAEGNAEQDSAREELLQRLLSLYYIRSVDGRYFVTKWGGAEAGRSAETTDDKL